MRVWLLRALSSPRLVAISTDNRQFWRVGARCRPNEEVERKLLHALRRLLVRVVGAADAVEVLVEVRVAV
eukprot:247898-Pleurochrysis_carterae.AAC.1